jgi:phage baseplate assembly protein W
VGSFNFKAAGKTKEQKTAEALEKTAIAIGFKTPLKFSDTDGLFAMHYTLAEQMHDNLRNLLLTNWGERLGRYNYGGNLRALTSEFVSQDDFDSKAVERISSAVSKWMPFISLENFLSEIDRFENKNTAIVKITITYSIPALSVSNKGLQIVLYVI